MPLHAIIFDLDGTLLDTLDDIAAACNHSLAQLGQQVHPVQAYRKMVGDGADVLLRRALPADRQDLADEAYRVFKRYYTDHPVDRTRPYPGIEPLLDALTSRGVPIAIHTNKPQSATEVIVKQLLGRWNWAVVAGHRPEFPKKPDPAEALVIARKLQLDPTHIGFVGDSNTDMKTAHNAGMRALGAAWGFRGREELLAHGAEVILNDPLELLDHL